MPQKMQRSISILNTLGRFSSKPWVKFNSLNSSASMLMQRAGQASWHMKQATHLMAPSSNRFNS